MCFSVMFYLKDKLKMNKYEIEIEKVKENCSCSYKKGDKFIFNGFETLEKFCGGAYVVAYPIISVFEFGGQFKLEDNPNSKTRLSCPNNGNIIFKVVKIDN